MAMLVYRRGKWIYPKCYTHLSNWGLKMAFATREMPFAVVWWLFFSDKLQFGKFFEGRWSWVWISPPNKTPGNGMDGHIFFSLQQN